MTSKIGVWTLAAALSLAGCAKLTTEISVFDPDCLKLKHATVVEDAKQDIRAQAQAAWDEADHVFAEPETAKRTKDDYDKFVDEIIELVDDAALDVNNGDVEDAYAKIDEIRKKYNDNIVVILGGRKLEALDDLSATIAKLRSTLTDSILEDPQLGDVLYATGDGEGKGKRTREHQRHANSCWVAVADETRSVTAGGNGDIAVTVRGDGTFTVKGLRLDASKVTQAIFKMSTQAVCLVASIYGVGGCSTTEITDAGLDPNGDAEIRTRKRAALYMLEDLIDQKANSGPALAQTIDARLPTLAVPEDSEEQR